MKSNLHKKHTHSSSGSGKHITAKLPPLLYEIHCNINCESEHKMSINTLTLETPTLIATESPTD